MIDYVYIYDSFVKGKLHPLYNYMYPGLIRYASRLLGDKLSYMAEDCVQDSVLSTYAHRDKLETMDRWRSWLLVSIRNRANEISRKASYAEAYENNHNEDLIEEDISLAIVEQEVFNEIQAAVEQLPDLYKELFILSFEKGLRNAEIADKMCVAEITVKKRKARLIEMLRQKLSDKAFLLVLMTLCLQ